MRADPVAARRDPGPRGIRRRPGTDGPLVRATGKPVGGSPADRQRPTRRDGLRRHRSRAFPAERGHAVGGRSLRSRESVGTRRITRDPQAAGGRPLSRGAGPGRCIVHVRTAAAGTVPHTRRPADHDERTRGRDRLPARTRSGHRDDTHELRGRCHEVRARGVRESGRPGARDPAGRGRFLAAATSRCVVVLARPAIAAACGGPQRRGRYADHGRAQHRGVRNPGRAAFRNPAAGAPGRRSRQGHRIVRPTSRRRCRRGADPAGGGDELSQLRRRRR